MTKRIVLINGWSDDNKGDAAIVLGLIKLLRDTIGRKNLKISIVSNFSAYEEKFAYHYRHISALEGDINVYGSILPVSIGNRHRVFKRLRRCWLLLRSLIILTFAPIYGKYFKGCLLNEEERKTLNALNNADFVISKGGHIFFSTGSVLSLIGLYQNLYPLLLAQRLRNRTAIYAQSVGPVKGSLQQHLLCQALAKTDFIYLREPLSLQLVNGLLGYSGVQEKTAKKVQLVWDTAFVIEEETIPETLIKQLPRRFVALTIRQWRFPYYPLESARKLYTYYLECMADLVSRINMALQLPVVLMPQVIGPSKLENDFIAWNDLMSYLAGSHIVGLKDDLTPGQLKSLYGRAEILIGTRFHSVILAISAGTPAVAISYHGFKTKGIMSMLGLKNFVFDMNSLDKDKLWNQVEYVYRNRKALSERLRQKLTLIRTESLEKIKEMLSSSIN